MNEIAKNLQFPPYDLNKCFVTKRGAGQFSAFVFRQRMQILIQTVALLYVNGEMGTGVAEGSKEGKHRISFTGIHQQSYAPGGTAGISWLFFTIAPGGTYNHVERLISSPLDQPLCAVKKKKKGPLNHRLSPDLRKYFPKSVASKLKVCRMGCFQINYNQ